MKTNTTQGKQQNKYHLLSKSAKKHFFFKFFNNVSFITYNSRLGFPALCFVPLTANIKGKRMVLQCQSEQIKNDDGSAAFKETKSRGPLPLRRFCLALPKSMRRRHFPALPRYFSALPRYFPCPPPDFPALWSSLFGHRLSFGNQLDCRESYDFEPA